jgi:c-di-GMP-binding flagellar brake protein YcgR
MEERRKYVRLGASVKIRYTILPSGSTAPETYSKDLSLGGIRIEIRDQIQPKTMLDLELMLPNEEEWLKTKGEVVWQEQVIKKGKVLNETGIRFLEMDIKDKIKLNQYLLNLVSNMFDKSLNANNNQQDDV